ncbi:tetratricopeptide repeat protein [bacterium]|nr:tetratricopeptide repeat protein [candidate division CSSED10-310 bacterium]
MKSMRCVMIGCTAGVFMTAVAWGHSINEANHLFLEGCYTDAVRVYSRILTDPLFLEHRPQAMYLTAMSYLQMGNRDMALRALWQVVGDYPSSDWTDNAYIALARIKEMEDRTRLPEALMLYETIPSRFPTSEQVTRAWMGAARVKMALGYYTEANEAVKRALESGSGQLESDDMSMDLANLVAHPLNPARDVAKAINLYTSVIQRFPSSDHLSDAYVALGKLHWELGDRLQAVQAFREVVIRVPATPSAEFAQESIARLHDEMGDREKAIAAYRVLLTKYSMSGLTRERIRTEVEASGVDRSGKPSVSAWSASVQKENNVTEYRGDVTIRFYQLIIQADRAAVDFTRNVISAWGNVRVAWADRHVIHGDGFQCDVSRQTAELTGNVVRITRTASGEETGRSDRLELVLKDGTWTEGKGGNQ